MAKKARKKVNKESQASLPDNILPQNILPMGDRVEENKNIYISQQVYKEIHKFTQNKTTNESGGMLIGCVIDEFGKTNIVISGFVEAKYAEGTPTTLKFTHETWDYVHKEIEKKHSGKKIVGWIHTHPDFGIFLSEYDKFIQQNFFSEDYQIAYVVDPIQNIVGFYFWINRNIERCKGFYIYDKTGVKITVETEKEEAESIPEKSLLSIKNIILALLSVAVVFLIFSQISTNNKLEQLQEQQKTIVSSANQSLAYMQQQLASQAIEIENLNKMLKGEETDIPSNEYETVLPSTEEIEDESTTEGSDKGTESTDTSEPVEKTTNSVSSTKSAKEQGGTVSE